MHLYSHTVLKRTSPLAVVSLGAYLSHGWYDALWMRRVHVIRAAASADDKVTRGVKAAYKQACPLPDRKLGAAEALPCLICQQHSLPHHSNHVWWCAQLHAGRLFWFQPVWHICCLSRCVVPACEPSATGANAPLVLLSVFTNRARAYKQASMVHIVWKVRRPYETLRAPAQLVSQAINPAASVRRVECECSVLDGALSANKPCLKSSVEVRRNCGVDCG